MKTKFKSCGHISPGIPTALVGTALFASGAATAVTARKARGTAPRYDVPPRLIFPQIQIVTSLVASLFLLAFAGQVSTALGQGATAFTYQGQLLNNGLTINGTNGMIFTLYSAATGDTAIGSPITNSVAMSNGLFTVSLDFGADAFNGSARWLGIAVSNGAANQDLSPRQQILPTPYATYAATANIANTATYATTAASATNFTGDVVTGSFFGNGGGLTNVGAELQMAVFPNPGTYYFTVPTNVSTIIVEAWGGGGAGGSGSSSYDVGGGGGGAGGYGKEMFSGVTPGTYAVTVGAGGSAGAPTGGNSGIDGVIIASGGTGGSSPTSISLANGGAGGAGVADSSTASGTKGGTGKYGTPDGGGDGGSAASGGPGGLGNLGAGAEAGHAPGGGGGGGEYSGSTAGGAGGSGEVIVYY